MSILMILDLISGKWHEQNMQLPPHYIFVKLSQFYQQQQQEQWIDNKNPLN